jgi:hypothetical protein
LYFRMGYVICNAQSMCKCAKSFFSL